MNGSDKLDAYCTASIVVCNQNLTNQQDVRICKTHYGHQCTLGHTRVQYSQRQAIAGKLAQGVTKEHILDSIRDNIGKRFERIHIITRKDIINIERSFGLQGNRRHDDDATSVKLWVEEINQNGNYSPVLLYKGQGQEGANLQERDFVLGIQTQQQGKMLKTFGNDRVVCIDATHGTNGYDFSLITIIVVDEFGEGYPVAWCLSNRTDFPLLASLFEAIKNRIGVIMPNWIMTDDADQFYSAWIEVFGRGPKKLLCTWHVDRAWRGHLNSVRDRELAQSVYQNLRVLLEETNVAQFESLLMETRKQLYSSTTTEDFFKYFETYYVRDQWALCYRKFSHINTNMYVEAFHRVIKYLYLKGKTNKRIDKCILVLMKYERDKIFERVSKLEKGKISGRIALIMKRHTTSKSISKQHINQVNDATWTITSEDFKQEYTVVKEQDSCMVNCALRCHECDT